MKKIFASIIFSLLLSASCLAQAQTGVKYIDTQLDSNKLNEANADLSQIEIDFCDKPGEKVIMYTVTPGGNQDICFNVSNTSSKDIQVTIGFVDGTVTSDQQKNKSCMQQGQDKNFGQYVTGFVSSVLVPAQTTVVRHATLHVPGGVTGTINGCLVYYTKGVAMGGQVNFTVLMRKAKFIDVTIKHKAESVKRKDMGIFLGIIMLLLFFGKFRTTHLPPK